MTGTALRRSLMLVLAEWIRSAPAPGHDGAPPIARSFVVTMGFTS
jgi:hypothetical protein